MRKSYSDLNSLHLPVISLTAPAAPVIVIEPKDRAQNTPAVTALCARLSQCKVTTTSGPDTLGEDITAFIRDARPAAK